MGPYFGPVQAPPATLPAEDAEAMRSAEAAAEAAEPQDVLKRRYRDALLRNPPRKPAPAAH